MSNKDRIIKCLEESGIQIFDNGDFGDFESMNFISAIISLEQEFGFEFPDEYLSMNMVSNLKNTELVVKKILKT